MIDKKILKSKAAELYRMERQMDDKNTLSVDDFSSNLTLLTPTAKLVIETPSQELIDELEKVIQSHNSSEERKQNALKQKAKELYDYIDKNEIKSDDKPVQS